MDTCSSPIPKSRWTREDGFGLIEVLVSLVLLGVVTLGVLAMIDGPSAVSGASRARSTASALAQQDQDRMRGMTATDLNGFAGVRTVVVGGVSYTVRSKASWVSDASGTESCTSGDTQAHYLKITSSVTWPSIGTSPAVTATSLMAPPASMSSTSGGLAVQLTDQAGAPIRDMPVRVNPGSFLDNTNESGCAFFGALAIGNVTASFGQAGWVDVGGNSNVTLAGSVSAGSTTTLASSYAPAAQIAARFDTRLGNAAPVAAQSNSVRIVNPNLPPPGFRTFTVASPSAQITATDVYPFTSGYGVYAGSCDAANPVTYNPNYFTQNPGSYARPGPRGTATVTVRKPALNIKVVRGGSARANAHVVVAATGVGCSERYTMTTDSAGILMSRVPAPYHAPAVPFGAYSVCADDGVRRITVPVLNTDPNGNQMPQTTLVVPNSGTMSTCVD